ncbi:hypothetical protein CAPTEDRAFT_193078 [Capitella teleta]|uniref:CARD domain-containing protein n=1 Tax=Capitella teleta TaxID=283909 RepID=R7V420_CAPTE|nr:hypothetical protein CAPTEDRAFT_193078 [Capitella teleta]|eukprot:ELU13304.1 hypothetical protein CAPTEDRAFT_193078 [Capitella teleta]
MDPRDKDALLRNFVLLTDDLDTPPICDYLIQETIITSDDAEQLKDKCKKERNRDFINMLMQKGPLAFGKFMTTLKTKQPHLHDAILEVSPHPDLPNPNPIQPAPVPDADQLTVLRLDKLRDATGNMEKCVSWIKQNATIARMISQDLKDKADDIREMGGAASVDREIENNKAVLQQSQRTLNEVDKLLQDERKTDDEYRGRYGQQWQMLPFDRIVQPLEIEAEEYRKTTTHYFSFVTSVTADYRMLRQSIERLSQSDSDLERWLYSCSDPRQQRQLSQLRRLYNQWQDLQSERSKLEHELVESHTTDDRNLHQVSSREFGKRVSQSTESQKRIVTEMQRVKQECEAVDTRDSNQLIESLSEDYLTFLQLKSCIAETQKCCNKESQAISSFKDRLEGFCRCREMERRAMYRPIMWVLNEDFQWRVMSGIPFERSKYSACASPNGIIVTGGYDQNKKNHADCHEYYSLNRQWQALAPMLEARYEHCSLFHQNALYIIGGKRDKRTYLSSFHCMQSGQWRRLRQYPHAIAYPYAAVALNQIFAFGGWKSQTEFNFEVFEYDSTREQWLERATMPKRCTNGSVAAYEGKVYVVGGDQRMCMSFNPQYNSWVEIQKRPQFEHCLAPALVWDTAIVVFGGKRTESIEQYCILTSEWSEWNISMPTTNFIRFALYVHI